jgi:hypothetical protein
MENIMSKDFMSKPCQHCPYRVDVKPFLTASRGMELAYAPQNPCNDFPCHKTTEHDEEGDTGEMLVVESSKTCAGFLTMMAAELGDDILPEGFEPSYDLVYSDAWEMSDAYEEAEK